MLALAGVAFAVWAGRTLGRSLTPFPRPVGAGLVTRGPFAIVRHPIYTGGLAFFVGYSAVREPSGARRHRACSPSSGPVKIRVEERLLAAAYDGYGPTRSACATG